MLSVIMLSVILDKNSFLIGRLSVILDKNPFLVVMLSDGYALTAAAILAYGAQN
jgi:hypothetical protein